METECITFRWVSPQRIAKQALLDRTQSKRMLEQEGTMQHEDNARSLAREDVLLETL